MSKIYKNSWWQKCNAGMLVNTRMASALDMAHITTRMEDLLLVSIKPIVITYVPCTMIIFITFNNHFHFVYNMMDDLMKVRTIEHRHHYLHF